MSTVDERIVSMKIDNSQLLSGVKSTQSALQTLNKAVDGAGNTQGMTKLGSAVETVKTKFSALQVVGVTAIATVANKAVNAGIGMIKSLTIDPIMDGYHEYETKLKSIQTIMANTDAPIGRVTSALNNLNRYSDMTIYNFGEMAKNIGTFTAAGVSLRDSVASIKGIANVAALSGSSSQQAASAMYQLSQAIAAGKVGAQDWNSVVNAGMAGKKFQNALAQTAVAMGKLNKAQVTGIKSGEALKIRGQSFRNSIMALPGQTSWLTSGILVKTLATMDGRFSSLALSMEKNANGTLKYKNAEAIANHIREERLKLEKQGVKFSDEEFRKLKRNSNAAVKSATVVKTFGQAIDVARETIGSGIAGIFENLIGNAKQASKIWTAFSNTLNGGINAFFIKINAVLASWKKLGGYKAVWNGFGNIFKALGNLISPFVKAFRSLIPATGDAGKGLADASKGFEAATEWLERITRSADVLTPVLRVFFEIVKIGAYLVGGLVKSFVDLVSYVAQLIPSLDGVGLGTDKVVSKFSKWADLGPKIGAFFDKMIDGRAKVLDPMVKTIQEIEKAVGKLFQGDVSGFQDAFGKAFENLAPLGDVVDDIGNKVQALGDKLFGADSKVAHIGKTIQGFGKDVTTFFEGFGNGAGDAVSSSIDKIGKSADAASQVGGKAASGWDKFVSGMSAVKDTLGPIFSAIGGYLSKAWDRVSKFVGGIDKISLLQTVQIVFSAATILYVKKFMDRFIDVMETVVDVKKSVTGAFNQVTSNLKTMQTAVRAKVILNIAIAIGVLAASLWVLSRIPAKKLAIGIGAVGVLMRMLTVSMSSLMKAGSLKSAGKITLTASAMVAFAGAIVLLAGAVALVGRLPLKTLSKGLLVVVLLIGALAGAAAALGAIGPAAAAGALALGAMALTISVSIGALAISLGLMAATIKLFSKMKWSTIKSGIEKIARVLVDLGLAMAPMALLSPGILLASVALGVLSVTLSTMLATIILFSKVDIGPLLNGLGKMLLVFAALSVAGLLAPGIIALAAALGALGLAMVLVGGGVALLGLGLATIAAAGLAAFGVLIAGAQMFVSVLPILGIQFIAAMTTILQALADASPKIIDALVKIGRNLLRGFVELLPDIREALGALLSNILQLIEDKTPELVTAGAKFLAAIIRGLGENAVTLVTAMGDTILKLLDALDLAVNTYEPQIIEKGKKIAGDILKGLYEGLVPEGVRKKIGELVDSVVGFFKDKLGIHSPSTVFAGFGGDIISGLINGIGNMISNAVKAIGKVASKMSSSFVGFMRALPGRAAGALSGLGSSIGGAISSAFDWAKKKAINGVSSIASTIGHLPGRIAGLAGDMYKAGSKFVGRLWDGIKEAASGSLGSISGLGHALSNALGLPRDIGGTIPIINKKVSVHIPGFAKGTDYFGGGLAMVGEQGAELVSMPGGSSVITNKNLIGFIKAVSTLARTLSRGTKDSATHEGSIIYRVSANMHGDPKKDGLAFAGNLVAGLRNGLSAGRLAVRKAGSEMGDHVKKSFAETLEIHSPSKVFERMGFNVSDGFVKGILGSMANVIKAGKIMAQNAVDIVSKTATIAQQKADALQAKADALREASQSKKLSKNRRQALKAAAEAAEKQAKAAQKAIDRAEKQKAEREQFKKADNQGKADILNSRAKNQAEQAEKQRQEALKLAYEADLIRKTDAKKARQLDEQANAALKKAQKAAKAAKDNAEVAKKYEIAAAQSNTTAIQKSLDAARAESDIRGFGMTDAERSVYYKNIIDTQTEVAQKKYAEAQTLLEKAKAEASTNAAQAAKDNAAAQSALDAAQAAAQKASEAAQAAGQSADAMSGSSENPFQMPDINIVSSNVYGAQNMFEAYAKALATTSEAASVDNSTTVNLTQNNTSPKALSPTEIYRQTNNLLSNTERKLAEVL